MTARDGSQFFVSFFWVLADKAVSSATRFNTEFLSSKNITRIGPLIPHSSMASLPPKISSCACRVATRVRPQYLERKAPVIAATCKSFKTNSRGLTQSPCLSNGSTKCRLTPRRPSSACLRRSYHSYDHPSPVEPFSPTERTILSAAYAHVPEHGFSQESLALGARDSGYLDISTNLLPNGVFSLVQWHMVSQRESLAERARHLFSPEERMGVGRKVEGLVWERLMGNKAVIGRWQEVRLHYRRGVNCWRQEADRNMATGSRHHGPTDLCARVAQGTRQALRRDLVSRGRYRRRLVLVHKAGVLGDNLCLNRAFHDNRPIRGLY